MALATASQGGMLLAESRSAFSSSKKPTRKPDNSPMQNKVPTTRLTRRLRSRARACQSVSAMIASVELVIENLLDWHFEQPRD
ncbi:MAG: hypothetical protein ACT6SC_19580, partial [Blastomonas fulva]